MCKNYSCCVPTNSQSVEARLQASQERYDGVVKGVGRLSHIGLRRLQLHFLGSFPDSVQSGFKLVGCHELLHTRARSTTCARLIMSVRMNRPGLSGQCRAKAKANGNAIALDLNLIAHLIFRLIILQIDPVMGLLWWFATLPCTRSCRPE
ncbi:hypothetical protein T492DRAFT_442768 [Pavlovales sp. CCMP2436]|nr:hypothetical protein T492DRAFT_442768 [Pavlovales sp. CCMP2436]